MSKQSDRRRFARLRSSLLGQPLAVDRATLDDLLDAAVDRDPDSLRMIVSAAETAPAGMPISDGVAVIPVVGVVTSSQPYFDETSDSQIEAMLDQATTDPNVRAIVLYVDSPGGTAIGASRLAGAINEAAKIKPMLSYVQGMAASKGYYLAAATGRILSAPDSLIGSVGTVMTHMDFSEAAKDAGIKVTQFVNTDSPKKIHGSKFVPLNEESTATLQAFVNSYADTFFSDVAAYRGVSIETAKEKFGQGDSFQAREALARGMVDQIVPNLRTAIQIAATLAGNSTNRLPQRSGEYLSSSSQGETMTKKLKAQLFAMGLVESMDATDEACTAILTARGLSATDETATLKALQSPVAASPTPPANSVQAAHEREFAEARAAATHGAREAESARIANVNAAAALVNKTAGSDRITAAMVLESVQKGHTPAQAMASWNETLAAVEPPVAVQVRSVGVGADAFGADAVEALCFNACGGRRRPTEAEKLEGKHGSQPITLGNSARSLLGQPLFALAQQSLELAGVRGFNPHDRERVAEMAMETGMGRPRLVSYSARDMESGRYIRAETPAIRPGDFPNILSGLANKFLDMVELDDDFSYSKISAVLPAGLRDFKPALMINKGVTDELEEVNDAEKFRQLGLSEEVLSYLFLRRFGGKFGWTPVMIANDDLSAFTEQAIGLAQAWEITQNRLVYEQITSNPQLLDGTTLFSDSAASGDNNRGSGAAPSDSEWQEMLKLYGAQTGVGTSRRVRGVLNTILVRSNSTEYWEAKRTFDPLGLGGLESKIAQTTANLGQFRGQVNIVAESELPATIYYGFRSPTMLNTATVVRAYFTGFGEGGRRETWYDNETKCTWTSVEGRIGVAVKNRRYAIKNAGA